MPFLLHGFYNFLEYPFHYMIVGIMIVYAIILHSDLKKLQLKKNKEKEIKKI